MVLPVSYSGYSIADEISKLAANSAATAERIGLVSDNVISAVSALADSVHRLKSEAEQNDSISRALEAEVNRFKL